MLKLLMQNCWNITKYYENIKLTKQDTHQPFKLEVQYNLVEAPFEIPTKDAVE